MLVPITPQAEEQQVPLRIITYNIRYANPHPVKHEKLWRDRCPLLCTQLRFITTGHPTAFICLQEALDTQVDDIQEHLGPDWAHIGGGREDGRLEGEFCPIFYRKSVWRCERSKIYWLSETPEKPSRGWDAMLPRIVTVGDFAPIGHDGRAVVMSTHFDHIGEVARQKSAGLILKIAREARAGETGTRPADVVLLGGDFNSRPGDRAYQTMVAKDSGMVDIRNDVPPESRYGNEMTYTSFDEPEWWPMRIDFLFLGVPSDTKSLTFGVLENKFDDGVFISDHRPVVADLEVRFNAWGGNRSRTSVRHGSRASGCEKGMSPI
ncbi:endonuclease/exonuclease/phosphatase family protein [Plectosphaerella cucumerina]|uniref:Endonuclease/exonuclease/phosphatase family protein n=1 Tax=Plectosphaerella cucumerina TaxID=40658 RepID=A0A8K0TE16_9PEZI|nr:endonuclease/exonuclease/phosphatase family protein [Plectosphaerella cucumerina]